MVEINLNHNVKVRLTELGLDILDHSSMAGCYKPDHEGYYTFQLHMLIDIFGKHQYAGMTSPFERNTIIVC